MKGVDPIWKGEPDEHDFPAALDYLTLMMPARHAGHVVDELREAKIIHRKAKDLLRASGLELLPKANAHVAADLAKIAKSVHLSPVLVVRDDSSIGRPLLVADGYHRICASYWNDENTDIPCRMVAVS